MIMKKLSIVFNIALLTAFSLAACAREAPNRDGYFTWEELGDTSLGQRKYPVRLVKE